MGKTVKEMLDRLASGRATLDQVAADFAARTWSKGKPLTEAQRWGVHDLPPADENSPDVVSADHRLTAQQYGVLFKAIAEKTR